MQGHAWAERDESIRRFARWLGFRHTGPSIDEAARSVINGLIRTADWKVMDLRSADGDRNCFDCIFCTQKQILMSALPPNTDIGAMRGIPETRLLTRGFKGRSTRAVHYLSD